MAGQSALPRQPSQRTAQRAPAERSLSPAAVASPPAAVATGDSIYDVDDLTMPLSDVQEVDGGSPQAEQMIAEEDQDFEAGVRQLRESAESTQGVDAALQEQMSQGTANPLFIA